jgi:uncharacterized protein with GYD domain
MPKYLLQASYTVEGLKGLAKDTASGRKAAVTKAVEGVGGKLDAFYFAFGADDVIAICDFPDNVAAAAVALTIGSSGAADGRTTPLLTVEEVDKALKKTVSYKAPGH